MSESMNGKPITLLFSLLLIVLVPQAFAENEDTIVIMETDMGRIIIEFFPDVAPNHVENFIKLSQDGFYTETLFHRIIEGFMIQGGDPKTADPTIKMNEWGTGDPGYSIDQEFNQLEHKRGIVSMARSADPNSAGSQFFIVHQDSNFLDGQYTVFGRILTDESFDTLDKIATMETNTNNDQPLEAYKVIIKDVQVLDRSELGVMPESSAPTMSSEVLEPPTDQIQTFKEYGISFSSPAGWLVQTPTVTSSTTPQIAVVGPKTSVSMPAISVRVDQTTKTLDEHIDMLRESLNPLIENKALDITGESKTQVSGYEAYVIKAIGHFQDSNDVEQRVGFSSVMIREDNLLYTLQYSNNLQSFDQQEKYFKEILGSLDLFTPQPMQTGISNNNELAREISSSDDEEISEGGGCLIATAAYGSEMAPQVQFLREIRDSKVMTTQSGTAFMTGFNQFYYSFSPVVADYERENPVFKEAVKVTLTPMLTSLTLLNYVDIASEEEMLGYGIGIILLNIGMYFVAPTLVINIIKNRKRHC